MFSNMRPGRDASQGEVAPYGYIYQRDAVVSSIYTSHVTGLGKHGQILIGSLPLDDDTRVINIRWDI